MTPKFEGFHPQPRIFHKNSVKIMKIFNIHKNSADNSLSHSEFYADSEYVNMKSLGLPVKKWWPIFEKNMFTFPSDFETSSLIIQYLLDQHVSKNYDI